MKYAFFLKQVWFWEINFRADLSRKIIKCRWDCDDTYLTACQSTYQSLESIQQNDSLWVLSPNTCINVGLESSHWLLTYLSSQLTFISRPSLDFVGKIFIFLHNCLLNLIINTNKTDTSNAMHGLRQIKYTISAFSTLILFKSFHKPMIM